MRVGIEYPRCASLKLIIPRDDGVKLAFRRQPPSLVVRVGIDDPPLWCTIVPGWEFVFADALQRQ